MPCFKQDSDYLVYLALLTEAARKLSCSLHAYCLMTNHIHLLSTFPSPTACAALMHAISHRYAHYFNRKYERTGTLWDGRYRSCLVESSNYVVACYRYIELNPVRAGIVALPEAYRWSSYAVNSGVRSDPLVSPHAEFIALGFTAYVGLMREAIEPGLLGQIREATNGGYPLVSASFRGSLAGVAERRIRRGRPGRPIKKTRDEKKSEPDPDLFSGDGAS